MPKTKTKTKTAPAKKKAAAAKGKLAAAKKAPAKKAARPAKKPAAAAAVETKRPVSKVLFKKEMTNKLLEAKHKLLQEVTQKIRTESDSTKFEIGDIYDIASNERERELTLMLGDRGREKLSEIEDALDRLKDNTYGECEECGEPVADNRLRALPFTRVCVECQTRNERELKIKGRFEEESGLGIMGRVDNEEEEF